MAKKTVADEAQKPAQQPTPEERGPTIEDRFAEFSARYKWYFIAPLAVIVIAAVALVIASSRNRAQSNAAEAAFRTAKTTADYETVAAQYPGTVSGRLALVRAADQLFRDGKYAEARAKYEAFLATRPDPLLAAPVRASVIQTYIREKNYTAAIEACNALLNAEGRQFAERQAMYYEAYCYEQLGQLGEAQTWYGKVAPPATSRADPVAQRAWWRRGRERLSEVQLRLIPKAPDLVGPSGNVPSPS